MKGKKGLLILLGVLVLLVAALLTINRLGGTKEASSDQAAQTDSDAAEDSLILLQTQADNLWSVAWENQSGTMALTKVGDWVWDLAREQSVDQEAVNTLVESLCSMTASRLVTEDLLLLSEFALDDPACTIRFSVLDNEYTLCLGLLNSAYGQYYALWQDKVYLLETDLSGFLSSPYSLLEADSLPDVTAAAVTECIISSPGETITITKPDHPEDFSYSDSYSWFLNRSDSLTALSATEVNSLVNQVLNLDLSDCLGCQTDGSAGDLSKYDRTVALSYTDSETGSAGMFVLYCKAPDSNAVTLLGEEAFSVSSEDEEEPIQVWLDGSGLVYGVSQSSLSKVMELEPDSLLPEDVCAIDFDELRSMVLTLDDVEYRFVMTPDESGTVSYTLNGSVVDENSASAIFSAVKGLSVEGTTDTPLTESSPVLTLKLYRDRETYAQMTFRLLPFDSSFYVIDFAGEQRLLVSLRDVEELLKTLRENLT